MPQHVRYYSEVTDKERKEIYNAVCRETVKQDTTQYMYAKDREKAEIHNFFVAAKQRPSAPAMSKLPMFNAFNAGTNDTPVYHHIYHHDDTHNDNFWFWMWLSNLWGSNNNSSTNNNSSRKNDEKKKNDADSIIACVVVIGAIVAITIPLIVSCYYLLSEIANNIERLYYNEGWLQATFGLMSMTASFMLSLAAIKAFLLAPIVGLCIAANFANPLAWASFIVMSLVAIGTGIGHLLMQEGLYQATAALNPDALHPEEPARFALTAEDMTDLRDDKQVDPYEVKSIITAAHEELRKKPTWTRFSPFFRGEKTAATLKLVRGLRQGTLSDDELRDIHVGDMSFNLRCE